MNRKENSLKTRKLATAAMMSALGVVVLYLGSVITVLDLTAVAIASLFVFFAVIELGTPYQYLIYAVTSLLSLLILPDKLAAVTYFLFGGIYPIFKEIFERLNKVISWILKFGFFNIVLSLIVAVSVYIMHIEDSDIGFTIGLYGLGNLTFFLYDIATTQLVSLYLMRLRQRFHIEKYFRSRGSEKNGCDIDKSGGKE